MTYKMGTYKITRRKRRKCGFYWTKDRKEKLLLMKVIIVSLAVSAIAHSAYDIITATNTITINGGLVRGSMPSAVPPVERESEAKPSFASLPVIVETVEEQIRRIAKEQNFKWTDYLVRLAKCESLLNPLAVNINKDGSRDRGLFQINKKYHPTVSDEQAFDIEFSTLWTMQKINEGKQHLWVCNQIILKK